MSSGDTRLEAGTLRQVVKQRQMGAWIQYVLLCVRASRSETSRTSPSGSFVLRVPLVCARFAAQHKNQPGMRLFYTFDIIFDVVRRKCARCVVLDIAKADPIIVDDIPPLVVCCLLCFVDHARCKWSATHGSFRTHPNLDLYFSVLVLR